MPTVGVFNKEGNKVADMELNERVFATEVNEYALHQVVVALLANKRQGTQSTKTRSEVRGGGIKPWRQKGTGRARQGSTRAPHMVGGGVSHGPKPRDYVKKVNKKVRKLAIRSALSAKVNKGEIIIIDAFELEKPKTKTIIDFSKKLDMAGAKQLYILNDLYIENEYNAYLSIRNIEKSYVLMPNELSVYWLLKQDKIIMTREALAQIEEVLA